MQEDVEAIAVRAVALLGSVLDQQSAACERLWRDLLAFVMQPDRPAEDMAQIQSPDPLGAGVGLASERQVTRLMAVADLVLGSRRQHLGCPEVRAPDLGLSPGQERVDHLTATAGSDHVVAGLGRLEHPLPLG